MLVTVRWALNDTKMTEKTLSGCADSSFRAMVVKTHGKDSLPGILNQGNEVENRNGLVLVAIQNGALQPRGMKEWICGICIPSTSSTFISKLTRGAAGEKSRLRQNVTEDEQVKAMTLTLIT